MSPYRIAFVTTANANESERIASALVTEGLAACVNIIPGITSFYCWEGKLEKDFECKLVIKTREDRIEALIERVVELHSYDVCEVTVLPIIAGNPPYLAWINANTSR
jgi:periplasmic divalent cation tolerance protein